MPGPEYFRTFWAYQILACLTAYKSLFFFSIHIY